MPTITRFAAAERVDRHRVHRERRRRPCRELRDRGAELDRRRHRRQVARAATARRCRTPRRSTPSGTRVLRRLHGLDRHSQSRRGTSPTDTRASRTTSRSLSRSFWPPRTRARSSASQTATTTAARRIPWRTPRPAARPSNSPARNREDCHGQRETMQNTYRVQSTQGHPGPHRALDSGTPAHEQGTLEFFRALLTVFPDMQMTVDDRHASGRRPSSIGGSRAATSPWPRVTAQANATQPRVRKRTSRRYPRQRARVRVEVQLIDIMRSPHREP